MYRELLLSSKRSFITLFRTCTFTAFWAIICLAQSTGGIQGTVTDATGAVLSNAEVEISNTETGQRQSITSNEAGNYVAPSLPTGTYTVQV
ncbi:MAG: carboxypeptidase-like regulatory domain-containing protein, partial [Bryobacteraceae bacterium]